VYVPVGAILPGMAYLVRRLLENTSNQSWLMHRHEEGDPAELLAKPEPLPATPALQQRPFANETPAQFYEPAIREAMHRALAEARESFGSKYPLLIGGKRFETGDRDEVRPPAAPGVVMGLSRERVQAMWTKP
jgi:RHH-type proline utilization regulon transcriptional repressor/proline dehydrogenase/delta 1-pyrroline-5-carboxylate dehydrogenase